MKKLITFSLVLSAVAMAFTGCLKDKGFENHDYGINYPGSKGAGVGFPLAAKAKNTKGLNVSATAQVFDDVAVINLESGQPAPVDVTVTLALKPSLVTEYNTANGTNIQTLPVTLFSLPSLTVVIPKGQTLVKIPITVSNTTTLDPNLSYGIGLEIVSVDGGFLVASNLKNLLIEVTIKNKYHGTYHSTGYLYHPSAPRPVDEIKDVTTSGANSVIVDLGDLGASGFYAKFTINDITNKVTIEAGPGAASAPYTQFDAGLPTTNPGYTAAWASSALCTNIYDPVTKTFYVRYGYMGATGWRVTEEKLVRQ